MVTTATKTLKFWEYSLKATSRLTILKMHLDMQNRNSSCSMKYLMELRTQLRLGKAVKLLVTCIFSSKTIKMPSYFLIELLGYMK